MEELEQHFFKQMDQVQDSSGPRLVITAFSGGLDSTVLLELVELYRKTNPLSHIAFHVDHGLRGNSYKDALHCQKVCLSRGVPFASVRLEAKPPEANLEAWARKRRYEELERIASFSENALILTAHHQDDQAETLLFRLLTGRIMSSARGISKTRGRIFRPLLGIGRKEICLFGESRGLGWVEDPSNEDQFRERNFIRHSLMPMLENRYGSGVSSRLSECLSRFEDDEEELEKIASTNSSATLNIEDLSGMTEARAWRTLRNLASEGSVEARKIGYQAWRALYRGLKSDSYPRRADLGFGISVEIQKNGNILFNNSRDGEWNSYNFQLNCTEPFLKQLPGGNVISSRIITGAELGVLDPSNVNGELTALFDFDTLASSELGIRNFIPGDSMRVWSRGRRKLKKLFQESGIAVSRRLELPIVLDCQGEIVWIPGVARADLAPVTKDSVKVLVLEVKSEKTNE